MDPEEATITTTGTEQETGLLPVQTAERRFGRYELGFEIASGGMATIFLARARGPGGFDRPFAIKRIHPHLAKQRDFVDMFLDEARLSSMISHPNVCSVVDFGEVDGTYFMAMEYLLGRPLTAVVKAVAGRPELHHSLRWHALAARIVADAAEGLHAAHELKDADGRSLHLVHRDVTPHNVILTYEGQVKVIDFGVAFAEGRAHETRTGAVKGKFAYMSPEQVRGRDIDRRVDVWALGVCLWEMLTGRRLYGKRPDVELIHAIVNDPLEPPSRVVPGIPPALDAIVMRALERDLDRRTPTARALGRELSTFVAASGVSAGIVDLAELMQELDGVERTKRLDVVASMMSRAEDPEGQATASGDRPVATATVAPPVAPSGALPPTLIAPVGLPPGDTTARLRAERPEPALEVRFTREQLAFVGGALALVLVAVLGVVGFRLTQRPTETVVPLSLPVVPPRPAATPASVTTPPTTTPPTTTPTTTTTTPTTTTVPTTLPPPVAPPSIAPAGPTTTADVAPGDEDVEPPERPERGGGTGTLNVITSGGWAEIWVDGEAHGPTPRAISLPVGRHRLELRRGDWVERRTVTIRRGAPTRMTVAVE